MSGKKLLGIGLLGLAIGYVSDSAYSAYRKYKARKNLEKCYTELNALILALDRTLTHKTLNEQLSDIEGGRS